MSLILGLFAGIDFGIYSLVALLFNLILEIANKDIFTDEAISGIAYKVYAILAVVIIFKVTIACIQYLVNPSTFSDNEKGLGGIFKRVLISLALMAVVPMLFTFAKSAQNTIALAIPQVILNLDSDEVEVDSAGDTLARMVLYVFIQPNEGKNADAVIMNKGDGKFKAWDLQTFLDKAAEGCTFFSTSGCKYDYKWYFSVPVGIFLLYMFLTMGIDVAVRAIKLGLLEILAPVCISSYITNGKNGKKSTFQNWYSLCIKVYSDLFIRLAIVYLIIFFVILISQGGLNFSDDNGWVTLFLILGVLYFAKSAPKFLSDVLGLDSDGALKDMFTPFHKKAGGLAAGAGMLTAGGANVVNSLKNADWKKGGATKGEKLKNALHNVNNARRALNSGIGGAASAGLHGGIAAAQGKGFKETMAAGHGRAVKARQNRDIDNANGVSGFNRMTARASDFFGIDTTASLAEGKQKAYSTVHQDTGNFKKSVMGRIEKNGNVSMRTDVKAGSAISEIGRLMEENRSTINSSGNQDLINYMNKFTKTTDNGKVCWKLKDGEHLSYHDIAAINADATQSGIGSIASYTSERGAITLQAQKEIMLDAMVGKVRNIDGSFNSDMNVVKEDGKTINESAHTDVTTAYGQAMQHITENALNLGEIEIKGKKYKGAEAIKEAYRKDYSAVDDAVERLSGNLSSQISGDKQAAARASIQRRNANKNKS